ncbi:MAG TPA: hypothetical protein VNX23_09415, partial [Bradyrhizobium sp.]|uniref:hypothetical protein n=1 Tax=Bradyrhizobium sp. TaxID=376 RepID=UPI002CB981AC
MLRVWPGSGISSRSAPTSTGLRDTMANSPRLSGGMLPKHIATGILTLIEQRAFTTPSVVSPDRLASSADCHKS